MDRFAPFITLLWVLLVLLLSHGVGIGVVTVSGMQLPQNNVALVTGSTDGIGVTTAKHLAARGNVVLLHGRDESRLARAQETVQAFVGSDAANVLRLPAADLSTVQGCESLVQSVRDVLLDNKKLRLQVLMNNAGVFSEERIITTDGTEQTFAVNVVAPFVITSHLLPFLIRNEDDNNDNDTTTSAKTTTSSASRIVIASSISQCSQIRDWDDVATYQRRSFSAHGSYSESKLLDAMLTMELSHRLQERNLAPNRVTCNCLDPGTVNTKMLLAGWGPCGIDVESALDQYWLCTSDDVTGVTGKYYVYQGERPAARSAYDPKERQRMWSQLEAIATEAAKMWDFDWLEI